MQYTAFINNLINQSLVFFNFVAPCIHTFVQASEKTEVGVATALSQHGRDEAKRITSGKNF
jgi:hypothetical protein